jgi:hypothetical protein
MNPTERDAAVTALERLAAELDPDAFATTLVAGDTQVPYLCVATRSPQLSETIYAQDGWFWWSWAERLTPITDVPTAAAKIATVLRSTVAARGQR